MCELCYWTIRTKNKYSVESLGCQRSNTVISYDKKNIKLKWLYKWKSYWLHLIYYLSQKKLNGNLSNKYHRNQPKRKTAIKLITLLITFLFFIYKQYNPTAKHTKILVLNINNKLPLLHPQRHKIIQNCLQTLRSKS